ncbi:MAG: head-tail connector protein [Eubacteriales bacterium]|nr:head-tail connector protein [Eubacteriales bacterium]MDD4390313.1 head-tail connector protein [Eubacteriales bacterium]
MAALTLTDVKGYLRVDFGDDDVLIESLMTAADEYLKASVGAIYDNTSERAKTLSLIVISDLYDNRQLGASEKVSNNVRKLVDDFSLQLRLELRP